MDCYKQFRKESDSYYQNKLNEVHNKQSVNHLDLDFVLKIYCYV